MNRKGFGLIGLLIAVVLIALLMTVVLKQYASQTASVLPKAAPPAEAQTQQPSASPAQQQPCEGKRVGNICVPTQLQSSSLEAFEQLNQQSNI